MKNICPNCEQETNFELLKEKELVPVRNEEIEVIVDRYKCKKCGDFLENTRGFDELEVAYREYRKKHGFLQPDDIQAWRKKNNLTQKELASLLNWSTATLSRYENGSLQSKDHDKFLRICMEPHVLLKLIEETPEALNEQKREIIIDALKCSDNVTYSFERFYEERFGSYKADVFSGYQTLNLGKLFNSIIFFSLGGQLKTKLNKLLFYSDFKYFKDHTISITGARYVHLQFGPVPDDYDFYFGALKRKGAIKVSEVDCHGLSGEKYSALQEPDFSEFDPSEIMVLAEVKKHFENYKATQIKNFSHNEEAYKQTDDLDYISYQFAESLKI